MRRERRGNDQLRAVIEASGLSYDAVARGVRRVAAENGEILRTNKSAVAHWVAGARPSGRARAYLAEALSRGLRRHLSPIDLGLPAACDVPASDLDPADVLDALAGRSEAERLALSAASFTVAGLRAPLNQGPQPGPVARMHQTGRAPGRAGRAEADVIRQITMAFAAADERLGGGHGLSTVTAYLSQTAAPILRGSFTDDHARCEVFGAAAELAYLVGFKHHDLGQEGAAQRYYLVGYRIACETGNDAHPAWMMRTMAQQALSLDHPGASLDLAEAALRRSAGALDPATEALLRITHARSLAATGDRHAGARALARAEAALHRTGNPQASFSQVSGPIRGTAASHMARAFTALGDHRAAERRHRDALALWDPVVYQRVHLLTHADLGDTLAAQHRAEDAVAVWSHAIELGESLTSGRTRAALASIRSQLITYRRRGVPGAEYLDQRIRACLT